MSRKITSGFVFALAVLLSEASVAQEAVQSEVTKATPASVQFENAIAQPELSSTLAWNIAAYVTCNRKDKMKAGILQEVTAAEANFDEVLAAMEQLTTEEFVCSSMKRYANETLELAKVDPVRVQELFGFDVADGDIEGVLLEGSSDEPSEKSTPLIESSSAQPATAPSGPFALPSPPRSTGRSATSDY